MKIAQVISQAGFITVVTVEGVIYLGARNFCKDDTWQWEKLPPLPNDDNPPVKDRSADTIDEMASFIRKEDGSMGAEAGCFDDRVISPAIACEARKIWGIGRIFPSMN